MVKKDYPVHHEEHELISSPSLTSKKFTTEQKIEKLVNTKKLLQEKIDELIALKSTENLEEYKEKYNGKYFRQPLDFGADFCYCYIKDVIKKNKSTFLVSGIKFITRNGELFTYLSCNKDIEDFEIDSSMCTEISKEEFKTYIEALKEQAIKNLDDIEVKFKLKGE